MRAPPFGTLFGTFLVLKIELEKRYEKRGKIGSPGDPKIEPKSSQGLPKEAPGGVPEASRKGGRKKSDFQTPWDSENEAPALSESSIFTFRRGPQNTPKTEPKFSENEIQIRPETSRGRSKSAP